MRNWWAQLRRDLAGPNRRVAWLDFTTGTVALAAVVAYLLVVLGFWLADKLQ